MSQIYKPLTSSGPIPPIIVTEFTTDVRDASETPVGTVVPVSNNVNLLGGFTNFNNINGIRTDANPNNGDDLFVELTNRATGSITTVGFSSGIPIELDLSTLVGAATSAVFTFDIQVAGIATVGVGAPYGCGFTIVGSVIYRGGAAVLINNQAVDHFEELALVGVESLLNVSGTDAIVTVTGVPGYDIDWNVTLTYTMVT